MVDLWGPGAFGAAGAAASRPPYTPTNSAGDPETHYADCTSPASDDGTEWRAAGLNILLAQMRSVARKSGVSVSNLTDDLLTAAIRSQGANHRAAGGGVNALTIFLDPAPTSNAELASVPLRLGIAASNTGPATLSVNGLAPLPIQTMRGVALAKGDLPFGAVVTVISTGTAYLLAGLTYSETLLPLRANQTFYVRTDGNDANDGFFNTAGSAFQTLTGAYNAVRSRYAANGYSITLQLGMSGIYEGLSHGSWPGVVGISGDVASKGAFVITGAPGAVDSCIIAANGQSLTARGITLQGGAWSSGRCAWAFGGSLSLQDIDWKAGAIPTFAPILTEAGGTATLLGAHQNFFAARAFMRVLGGSSVYLGDGITPTSMTVLNASTFYTAFTEVSEVSKVMNRGMTFSGAAVGYRYDASLNSIINSAGGGANYFPGDVAGTVSSGGQYA